MTSLLAKVLPQRLRNILDGQSLSDRTLSGGTILLVGEVYNNGIRLLANLAMTRMLYPEAFGLMLVVNLMFAALSMLSDVGIRSAIISRKEEVDGRFLNVAWTITILRGVCLGLIAVLIAKPLAIWYGNEQLFGLVLVASLAPVIHGFASPIPLLAERNIKFARVTMLHATTQTLAIMVTLLWLLLNPTIWALVGHGVFTSLFLVILSYSMFERSRVHLQWDPVLARELFHFGKWVLLGTALTFLGRQGDSLIVSRFLTFETLGIFSIAISFAKLIEMVVEKLSWGLLFPVFSEMKSHAPEFFSKRLNKLRLALYSICFPLVIVLAIAGRDIIELLYDPRYHSAGWMLEILALGFGFYILTSTVNSLPLSREDSKRHMWLQLFRVISVLGSMLVGGYYFDVPGLIWGIAIGQVVYYPLIQAGVRKYGVKPGFIDMAFAGGVVALVLFVWNIRGWPMPGLTQ